MKSGIKSREQGRKYGERALQLLVVLAGLRCAILAKNLPIGSDALAYLDLARAYLRHDWSTAVNGYWGPLYPLLIAGWLKVVHPGTAQEVAAVCVLNFLIFLLCFYSFLRLWRAIAQWHGSQSESEFPLPNASPLAWMLLGYVLFVVHTLWYIGSVGPDILVASVVLLISARMLELHAHTTTLVDNVGLGLLIAVGFFTKAILFYFGLAVLGGLLVGSLVLHDFRSRRYQGQLTAAVVCVLVVSPYVMALSHVLGHFSVGETGRLNYAWYVDGTEPGAWANGGASFPLFPRCGSDGLAQSFRDSSIARSNLRPLVRCRPL
jgi:hypothetical protein